MDGKQGPYKMYGSFRSLYEVLTLTKVDVGLL